MKDKKNIHGILGALILIASEYLMLKGVEPVASWFYCFAWWSYILIIDSLIYKIKRNSLIMNRIQEFLVMLFWSVVIWTLFEAMNLILKNWHYINVEPNRTVRWLGYTVAYATVLPGLFETTELLEALGLFRHARVKPILVHPLGLTALALLGIVSLGGVLFSPTYFFPLTWGCFTFLLEPINYTWGGRSLLREWEKGSPRKFYLLLTAGSICGILWEFWNFWAETKWVYTVPFVDQMKLFEMPVAGFLGFGPFGVECYVMYNCVRLCCNMKHGELDDDHRVTQDKMIPRALRAAFWLGGTIFCLFTFHAIDTQTASSYRTGLQRLHTIPRETAEKFAPLSIETAAAHLTVTTDEHQKNMLTCTLATPESERAVQKKSSSIPSP